jgi:midasin (ATPase involved in ribosome maturation)
LAINLELIAQYEEENELARPVFKFNKGILRFAMSLGYWIIFDNIDLAKPSVIERFNSLG